MEEPEVREYVEQNLGRWWSPDQIAGRLRRGITFDNGQKLLNHHQIARQLAVSVYFAWPAESWQRGASENTNELLRRCIPQRIDFTWIGRQAVARAETLRNERPRKRLNYPTLLEVLGQRIVAIKT